MSRRGARSCLPRRKQRIKRIRRRIRKKTLSPNPPQEGGDLTHSNPSQPTGAREIARKLNWGYYGGNLCPPDIGDQEVVSELVRVLEVE